MYDEHTKLTKKINIEQLKSERKMSRETNKS